MNATLTREQVGSRLASIPMFADLPRDSRDALVSMVHVRRYRRGAHVVAAGETAAHLCLITGGRVKFVMDGGDGRELVLEYLEAPDHFGDMNLAGNRNVPVDVVAVTDVEVLEIDAEDLSAAIRVQPRLALSIIGSQSLRIRMLVSRLEGMAFHDARHRVMRVLLNVATANLETRGSADTRGMTHYDIATLAGTSRETASRVISSLAKAGVVHSQGRTIVVDLARLSGELAKLT